MRALSRAIDALSRAASAALGELDDEPGVAHDLAGLLWAAGVARSALDCAAPPCCLPRRRARENA